MNQVTNRKTRSELKALQMLHKFEDYEVTERAGIMEHDGGLSKDEAEIKTVEILRGRFRK